MRISLSLNVEKVITQLPMSNDIFKYCLHTYWSESGTQLHIIFIINMLQQEIPPKENPPKQLYLELWKFVSICYKFGIKLKLTYQCIFMIISKHASIMHF